MKNLSLPTYRQTYFILFALIIFVLMLAAYLQYYRGIEPCLLCIIQRVIFLVLAFAYLTASIFNHTPFSQKLCNWITLLLSIVGIIFAARQVWLQHLPADQAVNCLPNFSYLLQTLPWFQVLKLAFNGTPDCAQITWTSLGMSMAEWALAIFVICAVVSVLQFFRSEK